MEILNNRFIAKQYYTNIYECSWKGELNLEKLLKHLDAGSYGGRIENIKTAGNNRFLATVYVYTD